MDGGKIVHPNQQADPKKQKLEFEDEDEDEEFVTTEGLPREERLNLFIASSKDPTKFIDKDYDEDLNGPHSMTMREFVSCALDDIEHGNFDVEEDYSNIDDASVVLSLYDPEVNMMAEEEDMITKITECAHLANGEYNGLNNTHFELKHVIKANIEAHEHKSDLWRPLANQGWKTCVDSATGPTPPPSPKNSQGYLQVFLDGGLNQQRMGIYDAVAVAKILNATLVIPYLEFNPVWKDSSSFMDIYDMDPFIDVLKDDISIVKDFPEDSPSSILFCC